MDTLLQAQALLAAGGDHATATRQSGADREAVRNNFDAGGRLLVARGAERLLVTRAPGYAERLAALPRALRADDLDRLAQVLRDNPGATGAQLRNVAQAAGVSPPALRYLFVAGTPLRERVETLAPDQQAVLAGGLPLRDAPGGPAPDIAQGLPAAPEQRARRTSSASVPDDVAHAADARARDLHRAMPDAPWHEVRRLSRVVATQELLAAGKTPEAAARESLLGPGVVAREFTADGALLLSAGGARLAQAGNEAVAQRFATLPRALTSPDMDRLLHVVRRNPAADDAALRRAIIMASLSPRATEFLLQDGVPVQDRIDALSVPQRQALAQATGTAAELPAPQSAAPEAAIVPISISSSPASAGSPARPVAPSPQRPQTLDAPHRLHLDESRRFGQVATAHMLLAAGHDPQTVAEQAGLPRELLASAFSGTGRLLLNAAGARVARTPDAATARSFAMLPRELTATDLDSLVQVLETLRGAPEPVLRDAAANVGVSAPALVHLFDAGEPLHERLAVLPEHQQDVLRALVLAPIAPPGGVASSVASASVDVASGSVAAQPPEPVSGAAPAGTDASSHATGRARTDRDSVHRPLVAGNPPASFMAVQGAGSPPSTALPTAQAQEDFLAGTAAVAESYRADLLARAQVLLAGGSTMRAVMEAVDIGRHVLVEALSPEGRLLLTPASERLLQARDPANASHFAGLPRALTAADFGLLGRALRANPGASDAQLRQAAVAEQVSPQTIAHLFDAGAPLRDRLATLPESQREALDARLNAPLIPHAEDLLEARALLLASGDLKNSAKAAGIDQREFYRVFDRLANVLVTPDGERWARDPLHAQTFGAMPRALTRSDMHLLAEVLQAAPGAGDAQLRRASVDAGLSRAALAHLFDAGQALRDRLATLPLEQREHLVVAPAPRTAVRADATASPGPAAGSPPAVPRPLSPDWEIPEMSSADIASMWALLEGGSPSQPSGGGAGSPMHPAALSSVPDRPGSPLPAPPGEDASQASAGRGAGSVAASSEPSAAGVGHSAQVLRAADEHRRAESEYVARFASAQALLAGGMSLRKVASATGTGRAALSNVLSAEGHLLLTRAADRLLATQDPASAQPFAGLQRALTHSDLAMLGGVLRENPGATDAHLQAAAIQAKVSRRAVSYLFAGGTQLLERLGTLPASQQRALGIAAPEEPARAAAAASRPGAGGPAAPSSDGSATASAGPSTAAAVSQVVQEALGEFLRAESEHAVKFAKAQSLLAGGMSVNEAAKAIGVYSSTLGNSLSEEGHLLLTRAADRLLEARDPANARPFAGLQRALTGADLDRLDGVFRENLGASDAQLHQAAIRAKVSRRAIQHLFAPGTLLHERIATLPANQQRALGVALPQEPARPAVAAARPGGAAGPSSEAQRAGLRPPEPAGGGLLSAQEIEAIVARVDASPPRPPASNRPSTAAASPPAPWDLSISIDEIDAILAGLDASPGRPAATSRSEASAAAESLRPAPRSHEAVTQVPPTAPSVPLGAAAATAVMDFMRAHPRPPEAFAAAQREFKLDRTALLSLLARAGITEMEARSADFPAPRDLWERLRNPEPSAVSIAIGAHAPPPRRPSSPVSPGHESASYARELEAFLGASAPATPSSESGPRAGDKRAGDSLPEPEAARLRREEPARTAAESGALPGPSWVGRRARTRPVGGPADPGGAPAGAPASSEVPLAGGRPGRGTPPAGGLANPWSPSAGGLPDPGTPPWAHLDAPFSPAHATIFDGLSPPGSPVRTEPPAALPVQAQREAPAATAGAGLGASSSPWGASRARTRPSRPRQLDPVIPKPAAPLPAVDTGARSAAFDDASSSSQPAGGPKRPGEELPAPAAARPRRDHPAPAGYPPPQELRWGAQAARTRPAARPVQDARTPSTDSSSDGSSNSTR